MRNKKRKYYTMDTKLS